MRFALGPLRVTIKNAYRRGATTIYQRSVPVDLMGRYPGKNIKVDLKTSDPVKVARMVERLNAKVEAEWAGLRASPDSSPTSLKAHAREYLGRWGLEPGATGEAAGVAIDLLHDHWDDKRAAHAAGDEEKHREATPEDYLSPVELAAWKALHVPPKPTVGDLRDLYLSTHKKRDDPKFRKLTDIAFDGLIAVAGDRDLSSFTREDARLYIAAQLDKGNKTGTVRRRLNTFVAAWAAYSREAATDLRNPFERLAIAGEGDDRAERKPFSADDLAALTQACRAADDDPRWLFALMIDTGARIGEIAGLALDDLCLSGAVPYVVIQAHPWRSLKTTNSAREVPLVGASLWAARRVVENAREGQRYAFPRYTKERKGVVSCATASASAALLKWIDGQKVEGVDHELRHTMADRLRAVQCPKPIIQSVVGHGAKDMTDSYGVGYDLGVKLEWLRKVAP